MDATRLIKKLVWCIINNSIEKAMISQMIITMLIIRSVHLNCDICGRNNPRGLISIPFRFFNLIIIKMDLILLHANYSISGLSMSIPHTAITLYIIIYSLCY